MSSPRTLRAGAQDPLVPVLRHAGMIATLRLLTTGMLPAGAVDGYGEAVLTRARRRLADEALLAAFGAASLPSTPYAYALDPTRRDRAGPDRGRPFRGKTAAADPARRGLGQPAGICEAQ